MKNNHSAVARIRAVIATFNAHDSDALALNLAADAELRRGDGSSISGTEALDNALRDLFTRYPDARLWLLRADEMDSGAAIVEWQFTGADVSMVVSALIFFDGSGQVSRIELRADTAALDPDAIPPAVTLDPQKVREMAESYTAAWCNGDSTAVGAHYAPHGWIRINATPAHMGQEGVAAMAAGFMGAFPGMVLTFDDLHFAGDTVVFCWTLIGTNSGPDGTGQDVKISGYEIWQLDENYKVAESHGYFDSGAYAHQVAHGVE